MILSDARLNRLSALSSVVQGIVVVVAVFVGLYQWKVQNDLARAQNFQNIAQQAAAFNTVLLENGELLELWSSEGKGLNSDTQRRKYRELLVQWLVFHENVYHQHQRGWLDDEAYGGWQRDLEYTVQHHDLRVIGSNAVDLFPGGFGQLLEQLGGPRRTAG
ncbi:MAG: hypothetical protein REI94_06845 [Moraxellaceae bacterium]|nr:hypothetical protein [Moraxellaceae bacterium]